MFFFFENFLVIVKVLVFFLKKMILDIEVFVEFIVSDFSFVKMFWLGNVIL